MKRLLMLVAVLSVATIACDAFNDNYGSGAKVPTSAVPGVSTGPGGAVADYASDTTVCETIESVKVTKSEETGLVTASALSVAEEGAEVTTAAEKIGVYTTKISVASGDKTLEFVLKQTAEKEFAVCSVTYGEEKVKSGEITVDSFNAVSEDEAKTVSAGTFKFEFETSETVAKTALAVLKDLVSDASTASAIEGSYFTEELKEPEQK